MQTVELKVFVPKDKEAWLDLRKHYVTATDWPKLRGTSKFGKAKDVLLDKLGLSAEVVETTPMLVGKAVEPFIRDLKPFDYTGTILYADPMFVAKGACACTPDETCQDADGRIRHQEWKVSNKHWKVIPEGYLDQGEFQMAVLGLTEMTFKHVRLTCDYDEAYARLQDGSFTLDDHEVTDWTHTMSKERGEEILEQATAWFENHVVLQLPLVVNERPSWKGESVDFPGLADMLKDALRSQKSLKEQLEAITATVDGYKEEAEIALANAKTLVGEGFKINRAYVSGKTSTDYAAALRGLQRHLTEEQITRLDELLSVCTTTSGGYTRWTIKE